jgi:hypothetical protein
MHKSEPKKSLPGTIVEGMDILSRVIHSLKGVFMWSFFKGLFNTFCHAVVQSVASILVGVVFTKFAGKS